MSKFIKRLLSVFLISGFFLQEISFAALPTAQIATASYINISDAVANPLRLDTPFQYVTVKEAFSGGSGKLLIHIQDAHTNLSGQQNLAGALDYLMSRYRGLSEVFVEGASTDVTLNGIKKIIAVERIGLAAKRFLQDGVIAGEEYLNLTSDHPMKIQGVEDEALSKESLIAYADLKAQREEVLSYLEIIGASLSLLKSHFYPQEILVYEKIKGSGEKTGGMSAEFGSLLRLQELAGISLNEYAELAKLKDLRDTEKKIDFDKANLEQMALGEALARKGASQVLSEYSKAQAGSRKTQTAQYMFLENILGLAVKHNIATKEYPELMRYRGYLEAFTKIRLDQALDEMQLLEERAYQTVLSRNEAVKIHAIERFIDLLTKAYQIKLTSKEFDLLVSNESLFPTSGWEAFLNDKLIETGRGDHLIAYKDSLEKNLRFIRRFYKLVEDRDMAFVENASSWMDKDSAKAAFLITGGYHTPHLAELMRQKNISYIVLTPYVTSETNQEKYEKLLLLGLDADRQRKAVQQNTTTNKKDKNSDEAFTRRVEAFGEAGELRLAAVYPKEVPILLAPEVKDLNQFLAAAKLAQSDVMRRASSASLSGAKLANADQAAVDLFKVYDAITILDDNNAKFLRATVLDLSDLTPSPIGKIAPTLSSIGVNIDGKYSVTLNDLRLEIGDKLIPIVARRYAEELNDQESEQLLSVTREAETAIRSRVAEIFGSKSISFDFVSAMKRTFVRKLLQKILLSKSQIQTFNQLFDQERRKQKAIREATNLKDSQKPLREWDRLYRELPTYFLKTYYTEETLNRDYSLSGAWDSLDNAMSRNSDNYEQDMNYDVLTSRTPKQLLIPDKVEFSRRLVKFADSLTEIVKKRELYVFALAMALQFNLGQDLQNDLVSKISQIDRAAAQPSSVTAAKLASGSAGETASSVERDASSVVRDASSDSLSGAKLAEVKLKRFDLVQSRDALVSHLSSVLPAKTADGKVIDVSALRVFNESIISPAYAGLINLDLQGSQWVLALFAPRMREPRVFFYSVSLAMGEINPSYQVRRIARSLLMDTAVEGMGPGAFTDAAGGGSEYVDMRLITPIFGGEPFLALYFQTGVLKDGDKGKVVSKYSRGVFSVLGAADDVSWGDQRFVQPDEGLHLERAPSNVYRLFVSAPNDLLNTPERICLITTGQAPTGARLATPGQETAGKLADKLDSIADQYIPSDTYSTDNARDFLKTAVGRLRRYHTGDPQHSHLLRQSQDQIERALYGDPDSTDTVINDIVRNILSGNPDAVDFLRRRYGDKKGLKRIADDNLPLKQYPVRLPDNRKIFVAGLDAEFICKYVINVFDLLIQVRDLAIRMEPDGAKLATVQPVQYLGGVNINSVYGQLNFKIVEAIEVRRVMIEIERMCSQLRVEFAQLKMQTVRHGEKVIDVRRESETLLLPITFLHVSVNLLGAKLASMPSRPLDGAAIRQALTDLESASVCLKVIETLAQKKGAVKVFDGKAMWESQGRLPADVVTVRDRVLACATLLRYGIAQASYELVRMRDAGEAPGNASITIFLLLAGIAQDFGISLENLERKIQEEEGPVGLDIALLLRQTQMAISSTEKVTGIFEAMVTGAKLAGAQRAAAAYSWTAQQPVKYTSDTAGRTQWLADWLKNTTGATPAWQEHFTRFAKAGYAITVVSSAAGMVQISLSIPASNGSSGISPGRAIAVVRTVPIDNPLVAKEMNEVCTNLGHMTSAPDSAAEQNAIMASMRRLAGYFEDPRIMLEALADRQLANWVDNRLSGDREGYEEVLDEEWIDGKPRPSSMRMDTEGIIQGVLNQTIGFKHGSFYQAATSTDAAPRAIPADLMRRQTVQLYTDYGSPIYQTANGQRIDMITPLVKILFSRHYVDLAQTVDRPQLRTSLPDYLLAELDNDRLRKVMGEDLFSALMEQSVKAPGGAKLAAQSIPGATIDEMVANLRVAEKNMEDANALMRTYKNIYYGKRFNIPQLWEKIINEGLDLNEFVSPRDMILVRAELLSYGIAQAGIELARLRRDGEKTNESTFNLFFNISFLADEIYFFVKSYEEHVSEKIGSSDFDTAMISNKVELAIAEIEKVADFFKAMQPTAARLAQSRRDFLKTTTATAVGLAVAGLPGNNTQVAGAPPGNPNRVVGHLRSARSLQLVQDIALGIKENQDPMTRQARSHLDFPGFKSIGFLYDEAVLAMALYAAGMTREAEEILDYYEKILETPLEEVRQNAGAATGTYGILKIYKGPTGQEAVGLVNAINVESPKEKGQMQLEHFVTPGPTAFMLMAMLQVNRRKYLKAARKLGNVLVAMQDDDGAIVDGDRRNINKTHVEPHMDAHDALIMLQAVEALNTANGDSKKWGVAANRARRWFAIKAHNRKEGTIAQGVKEDGQLNRIHAPDIYSWTMAGPYGDSLSGEELKKLTQTMLDKSLVRVTLEMPDGLTRMLTLADFTDPDAQEAIAARGGVHPLGSVEFLAGIVLALQKNAVRAFNRGDLADARYYKARAEALTPNLIEAFYNLPGRKGRHSIYSTSNWLATAHGWNTPIFYAKNEQGETIIAGASAAADFAVFPLAGFNPLVLGDDYAQAYQQIDITQQDITAATADIDDMVQNKNNAEHKGKQGVTRNRTYTEPVMVKTKAPVMGVIARDFDKDHRWSDNKSSLAVWAGGGNQLPFNFREARQKNHTFRFKFSKDMIGRRFAVRWLQLGLDPGTTIGLIKRAFTVPDSLVIEIPASEIPLTLEELEMVNQITIHSGADGAFLDQGNGVEFGDANGNPATFESNQVVPTQIEVVPSGAKLAVMAPSIQYLRGGNTYGAFAEFNFRINHPIKVRDAMTVINRICSQNRCVFAGLHIQTVDSSEREISLVHDIDAIFLSGTSVRVTAKIPGAKLAMPDNDFDKARLQFVEHQLRYISQTMAQTSVQQLMRAIAGLAGNDSIKQFSVVLTNAGWGITTDDWEEHIARFANFSPSKPDLPNWLQKKMETERFLNGTNYHLRANLIYTLARYTPLNPSVKDIFLRHLEIQKQIPGIDDPIATAILTLASFFPSQPRLSDISDWYRYQDGAIAGALLVLARCIPGAPEMPTLQSAFERQYASARTSGRDDASVTSALEVLGATIMFASASNPAVSEVGTPLTGAKLAGATVPFVAKNTFLGLRQLGEPELRAAGLAIIERSGAVAALSRPGNQRASFALSGSRLATVIVTPTGGRLTVSAVGGVAVTIAMPSIPLALPALASDTLALSDTAEESDIGPFKVYAEKLEGDLQRLALLATKSPQKVQAPFNVLVPISDVIKSIKTNTFLLHQLGQSETFEGVDALFYGTPEQLQNFEKAKSAVIQALKRKQSAKEIYIRNYIAYLESISVDTGRLLTLDQTERYIASQKRTVFAGSATAYREALKNTAFKAQVDAKALSIVPIRSSASKNQLMDFSGGLIVGSVLSTVVSITDTAQREKYVRDAVEIFFSRSPMAKSVRNASDVEALAVALESMADFYQRSELPLLRAFAIELLRSLAAKIRSTESAA